MRRRDDIVAPEERVLLRRLLDKHVDRGAGDLAVIERRGEILLDDQPAARAIDEPRARLQLGQRLGVEHAARRLGHRRVQGHEIGARQ